MVLIVNNEVSIVRAIEVLNLRITEGGTEYVYEITPPVGFNKDQLKTVYLQADDGLVYAEFVDDMGAREEKQLLDAGMNPVEIRGDRTYKLSKIDGSAGSEYQESMRFAIRRNALSSVSSTATVSPSDTQKNWATFVFELWGIDRDLTQMNAMLMTMEEAGPDHLLKNHTLNASYTLSDSTLAKTITVVDNGSGEIEETRGRESASSYASATILFNAAVSAGLKEVAANNFKNATGKSHTVEVRLPNAVLVQERAFLATTRLALYGIPGVAVKISNPIEPNFDCGLLTNNSIELLWESSIGYNYALYNNYPDITSKIVEYNGSGQSQSFINIDLNQNKDYKYTLLVSDAILNELYEITCTTTCILPGATVLTPSGKKLIDDIKAGDIVVDENGNHIKVIHNIRSGPSKKKVITFKRGCFGISKPDQNLSITSNHPIKRLGQEVLVENCVNNHSIRSKSTQVSHTFTLMTEKKSFVMTNGIPVATYSQADFEKQCEDMKARGNPLLYRLL